MTAATPAALGAAIEVPPIDRNPLGPIRRVSVGATMSGFRRPSAVGPCDEYDLKRSPRQSTAPTATAPTASPGVGTLPSTVPEIATRGISRENRVSGPFGAGPDTRIARRRKEPSAGGR